jgi:hypothetical protein
MDSPDNRAPLLRESEVARILNIEVATLRRWRWAGRGPVFVKLAAEGTQGGAVRYRPEDVQAFVEEGLRNSTSANEVTPSAPKPRRRRSRPCHSEGRT